MKESHSCGHFQHPTLLPIIHHISILYDLHFCMSSMFQNKILFLNQNILQSMHSTIQGHQESSSMDQVLKSVYQQWQKCGLVSHALNVVVQPLELIIKFKCYTDTGWHHPWMGQNHAVSSLSLTPSSSPSCFLYWPMTMQLSARQESVRKD